jgi:hypothetical protein
MYGDIDEKRIAQRVLYELKQIRPATDYASNFQLYAARIGYDDEALMTCYRQGLKNRVKDMMMLTERPTELHTLISKSIEIDNTQYERELEKKDERQIFLKQRKKSSGYYSVEMELDAIIRNRRHDSSKKGEPRTKTFRFEKPKNKATVTCYECGKSGHYKRDCRSREKLKEKSEEGQLNAINQGYERIMAREC